MMWSREPLLHSKEDHSKKVKDWLEYAHQIRLFENPQWFRLMHYHKSIFQQYRSEAIHKDFFLSNEGNRDPQSELVANIRALLTDPIYSCRFPARKRWLNSVLQGIAKDVPQEDYQDTHCKDHIRFQNQIGIRSLTFVFSGYYINSPSSTFGHTLLRLNRRTHEEGHESSQLLDFGVNYAANPSTSNPFLYAILGLTGGFPGTFTLLPYFYKVREYNDFEARDLWEYDLDLTQEELDQLVDHLWELIRHPPFQYYYLTKNCSYEILALLEVASPRLNLVSDLPPWMIPTDTLKALYHTKENENPLVRKVRFRPSIQRQLFARIDHLSKEWRSIEPVANGKFEELQNHPSTLQASIIDASLDYVDYKYSEEILVQKNEKILSQKNKLLIERSKLPVLPALKIETPIHESPQISHGSSRTGVELHSNQDLEISYKFAFHDYLDSSFGYSPYTMVDFFNLQWILRYRSENKILLKNLTVLGLSSLFPINNIEKNPSWRLKVGFDRSSLRSLDEDEMFAYFDGGAGYSFAPFKDQNLIGYFLLDAHLGRSFQYSENHRIDLGPSVGIKWNNSNLSVMMEFQKRRELLSRLVSTEWTEVKGFITWSPHKKIMMNSGVEYNEKSTDLFLGLYTYFY